MKSKYKEEHGIVLIRLPAEMKDSLEGLSNTLDKNQTSVYNDATLDFLKWRQSGRCPQIFFYSASSNKYPLTAISIHKNVQERAKAQADKDGVSLRVLLLTAIIKLIEKHG